MSLSHVFLSKLSHVGTALVENTFWFQVCCVVPGTFEYRSFRLIALDKPLNIGFLKTSWSKQSSILPDNKVPNGSSGMNGDACKFEIIFN